jgi:hypothetical protein
LTTKSAAAVRLAKRSQVKFRMYAFEGHPARATSSILRTISTSI